MREMERALKKARKGGGGGRTVHEYMYVQSTSLKLNTNEQEKNPFTNVALHNKINTGLHLSEPEYLYDYSSCVKIRSSVS